jgi:hypothetical protein
MTPLNVGPYLLGVRSARLLCSYAQGADTGVRASALICTCRRADIAPGGEGGGTPFEAECLLQERRRYALGVSGAGEGLFTSRIYYGGDKFVSDVAGVWGKNSE